MAAAPIVSNNPSAGRTGTAGLDAMALPQGINFADILNSLVNLTAAAGKTTSTDTTTSGATSEAGSTLQTTSIPPEIVAAIMSAAGDYSKDNATAAGNATMVAALQSAAEQFAPVLAAQAGTGAYNSSAIGQMANAAMVRAAGETARTNLQAQTQFGQVQAENLRTAASVAPKTTTGATTQAATQNQRQQQQQVQIPKVNPFAGIITSVASGVATKKIMDIFKASKADTGAFNTGEFANNAFGRYEITNADLADASLGQASEAFSSFVPASTADLTVGGVEGISGNTAFTAGFGEGLTLADTAAGTNLGFQPSGQFLSDAANIEYGTTGYAGQEALTGAEATQAALDAEVAAEAAQTGTAFTAGGESVDASSVLAGVGGAVGGFEAAGGVAAADEIIGGILGADAVGGATAVGTGAAVGEGFGAAAGAGAAVEGAAAAEGGAEALGLALAAWVVCTELMRGGELDRNLYQAGATHIARMSPETIRGYHLWAVPYTRWMRASKLARKFILPWAIGRTKYLAGERSVLGWLTVVIGEPACAILGMFCNEQNWESLYTA